MKKLFTAFVVFALVLTGCGTKGKLSDATAQQAIEKLENKESMILVIGSTTCPACIQYNKTLQEVVKEYDVNAYEVHVDKEPTVSENGKEVKQDLLALLDLVGDINATPTVIFVVDGKVESRVVGSISYSDTIKSAKSAGLIKE